MDQNYKGQLEIFIVDDGSPYPIQTLAGNLGPAAKLVRWFRSDENRGIVSALNAGIAAARTPLIARLDADDVWLDGKLDAQIALFLNDPDLTISATGMVRVDAHGAEIDRHIRPGNWEGILRFFSEGGCPFPHGSVIADRRVFSILGGYPWSAAVRHCEDYALWGVWLRFFKPAMVEQVLYSYRVSDSSVSSKHAAQQREASERVRREFESLELERVLPRMLPKLADALGGSLFEAGVLSYIAWHFRAPIAIPSAAIEPLSAILPDRVLVKTKSATSWRKLLGHSHIERDDLVAVRAEGLGDSI